MRVLKWIGWALVVLVVAFGVYSFWTVRRSFPQVDGRLEVQGPQEQIEVIRDDWGVAHIYARNPHDLFFAQGFTHAQERFWQMDFWRHLGSARVSEMFGSGQVNTDKFLRSLGFVDLAHQELELLSPSVREILEWYSEGVNAYIGTRSPPEISLEYAILPLTNPGYEIEPWTPINTLTWTKMMSWDLSGNMREEIARAVLSVDLPVERVEQLYPPFPDDKPVIVAADQTTAAETIAPSLPSKAIASLQSVQERLNEVFALTGGGFEGIGSNNWVIGGSLTESGLPILANDTHLAIQMPSIWFQNGLHCIDVGPACPFDVVGFSFPGTPAVTIGHNASVAWGFTNESADTQDLYIERVNPDDAGQYEVEGAWVDFDTRPETIAVAGGDDITFEVRSTRHGPIISGTFLDDDEFEGAGAIDLPNDYAVALSWQTLQPSTIIEAVIELNQAQNYEDFRAAMGLWDIAAQNVVYADVEGNIAYQSTGEIPLRKSGDGRYPVPGWTTQNDWIGLVPFDDLPRLFNPPRDWIQSANQQVVGPGNQPFLGADTSYGYRAARIEELITENAPHDVSGVQRMQMDARDGGAEALVPHLLGVDAGGDGDVIAMQSRLERWSKGSEAFQAFGDSTGAAVYQSVWRHLLMHTFHDELPEDYWPQGGSRWFEVVRRLLDAPDDPWWDDIDTKAVETRDEILYRSLTTAHDELAGMLGEDVDEWTWGSLHLAHFENQTLGQSGIGLIEWLFNRTAPEVVGGSSSTIRAVGWDTDESYLVDWVPSQRQVVDLGDLGSSTSIHTTGQSGHAFHQYYDNMVEPWAVGAQGPMYWDRDEIEANATSILRLVPPDQG